MAPGNNHINHHFEWNFQVCQNPAKLRKPTCVMWKDVPVLFSPKSTEKRLDKQARKSIPPLCPRMMLKFFRREEQWGVCGVGRQNFRPVCQVFSPCFDGKKQHRNIFSHNTGWLAKFGWILTYLKISLEMAVTWLLPGAIQVFEG